MLRSTRSSRFRIAALLFGLALCWHPVRAELPPPPLSSQLVELGRQALAAHSEADARRFFRKAIELDPGSAEAKQALERIGKVRRVSVTVAQESAAPSESDLGHATLEETAQAESLLRQQLTDDVHRRLQQARDLSSAGQPEAALNSLRVVQLVVRSATGVDESVRSALDRQIQAQMISTVRDEERIVAERAEQNRIAAAAQQRARATSAFVTNQGTIKAIMSQFDLLMGEGVYNVLYNGGVGNISAATAPFSQARVLAQQARALLHKGTLPYSDEDPAPYAGAFAASTMGFLSQELQFEALKEYRYMLTLQDVARAAVPFPDDQIIEYPDAEGWRNLSERRIARYGKAVDVFDRDPKTKQILEKLDQPISMSFPNETPLEEVLKYIKQATQGANDSGIPIYVDPIGLTEADRTLTSPVTIDLDGVPLKTTLRLLLKQLGLTYTIKDGYMKITSQDSDDQQTEIRVYPVADLALIPLSLIGGGGGGGIGGGGGGLGGGGGGFGGGGLGGGGGGLGGGGGGLGGGIGGFQSVPPHGPSDPGKECNHKN